MNARMAEIKGIELKVNKAFAIEVLASVWINRRLASISKNPPAIPGNPVFLIFVKVSNRYLWIRTKVMEKRNANPL